MTIKQTGGIFGRNPTFNDVAVDGDLSIANDITVDNDLTVSGNLEGTTLKSTADGVVIGSTAATVESDLKLYGADATFIIQDNTASEASAFARMLIGESAAGGTTLLDDCWQIAYDARNLTFSRIGSSGVTGTATEAARINSGNDLLVAKTGQDVDTDGIELRASGVFVATADGATPVFANRRSSDGAIATFMRSGSTVGSIACRSSGGNLQLDTVQSGIDFAGSGWLPMRNGSIVDNDLDVGSATYRFDDIYATNGTIQTSDRNLKQDIAEISDAERRVAVAAKGLLRKFRWQSAVAEKGDDARIHFGIIAQDLQDAFTAEGLDAGDYAMFTSATWWERSIEVPAIVAVEAVEATYDEDGNELTPAVDAVIAEPAYTQIETYETAEEAPEDAVEKTRLGVRYSELLAFIIAAI